MIPALSVVRHTPIRHMTDADHYVNELHKFMVEIRLAANETRLAKWKDSAHLRYLCGRLHGLGFGMASMLIYRCDWREREELSDLFNAYQMEADFLCGGYQYPEAA